MFQNLDDTLIAIVGDSEVLPDLDDVAVSFVTPDKTFNWKKDTLNLFLYEVKENRKRREPAPYLEQVGLQLFQRRLPPIRVDCTYLVTAWADPNVSGDLKTNKEHKLLGAALQWLSRFGTIPDKFLAGDLAKQPYPPPAMAAQLDGKHSDGAFWSALGIPPRPAFTLVVTIAMDLGIPEQKPTRMVTSLISRYGQQDQPGTEERLIQVGGCVLDATVDPPAPVAEAWVQLETPGGEALGATQTASDGCFIFGLLPPGNYRLRWRAAGRPEPPARPIQVPSSTGNYDLKFT
ncbi:MAG: Pvc16 family protein [Desulfobaccales bacterium]